VTGRRRREEKKEKKRKEKAKERVLRRREKLREEAKKLRQVEKEQEHFRVKQSPYRKHREELSPVSDELKGASEELSSEPKVTAQTQVDDPRKVAWVKQKLEHNMKILEAIEEEMEKEEQERQEVHKSLEEKGAKSFRDKMDLMGTEAEAKVAQAELERVANLEEKLPKKDAKRGMKLKPKSKACMITNAGKKACKVRKKT